MSQQGGSPTGHQDDWWGQLYDAPTDDTGPAPTTDSLDDRFASASGTLSPDTEEWWEPIPRPRRTNGTPENRPHDAGDDAVERTAADGAGEPAAPEEAERFRKPVSPEGLDRSERPEKPEEPEKSTESEELGAPERPGDTIRLTLPRQAVPQPPTSSSSEASSEAPPPVPSYRAPWEPPPQTPSGPANFPPGPLPAGFAGRPEPGVPSAPDLRSPAAPPLLPSASQTLPQTPPPPSHTPLLTHYVGSGPPTYDADPTALPLADPDALEELVADTVLDGARYGSSTVRAVSVRGDSARYRGEPRRDALLTARFGHGEQALVLVAMATGARATVGAHKAAAEVCRWIGRAVGRSHVRLSEDIGAGRRGDLKSGLHRLTDRSLGRLRAGAAEQGLTPQEYTATLRCLLLPADPACRTRVFFGVGDGGLFRLRSGEWQDIEPAPGEPGPHRTTSKPLPHPEGAETGGPYTGGPYTPPATPYDQLPPPDPFLFRTSTAQPGDTLLMCTGGLADPLRGELELAGHLTARWSGAPAPSLAEFLADVQIRVKGYADDRTAAAVWEA
ncbi:protein phosphatase 2C domain-containing protein [Streptomyces sp. S6]